MSHLVIHCGGPKTGSSALQYTLGTSPEALNAHRLAYPLVTDETDPSRPSTGNASSIPRQWKEFIPGDSGRNIFEERTEDLLTKIDDTPESHTVILSSEYFSDLSEEEWRRVTKLLAGTGRTISTVTYFRRQVDQVNSILGQFIKSGFRPDPATFATYSLAEHRCLAVDAYARRLSRLPFAAVDLAPYDRRALAATGITADFLARVSRLTATPAPALATAPEVNPSFNARALAVKYALNLARPTMPENYAILAVLERIPEFRPTAGTPELVLPRQEVERIERHFAADNAATVATRGPAFAFLLKPQPEGTRHVDVTRPPTPDTITLFWRAWHETARTASGPRQDIMATLAPRLQEALEEALTPA